MTQSDIGIVELKACPFCGGEARAMGRDSGFIYCLNDACGAEVRTPRDSENDDALAARLWNARDPIITEMVEALEEARLALETPARRVFNDNGDHTIDTSVFDPGVYSACYYAARTVEDVLTKVRSK